MTRSKHAGQVPAKGHVDEGRKITRLALPLIAALAGNQLMGFVDTAMVGRLGPAALAGTGIGNWLYLAFTYAGVGCVLGIDPLISQAFGAGDRRYARGVLRQGLYVGAIVSVPVALMLWAIPQALPALDMNPETLRELEMYLLGRLPGIVPFLWFIAVRSYLQAAALTRPVVTAMLLANVINFIANALFIYGDGALEYVGIPGVGLPALGVFGSGLSSSLASAGSFLLLLKSMPADADPPPERGLDRRTARKILRLGVPVGLQQFARLASVSIITVMAGKMSAEAAAAFHIMAVLGSMSVTVANGVGAAATVRVGYYIGQRDTSGARRAGTVGLVVVGLVITLWSLIFVLFPRQLTMLFTHSETVIAAAVPLLMVAAVVQWSDGTQRVAASTLLGVGDTRVPLYVTIFGHYFVGIPVAYVLAFQAGIGVTGLAWGITVAYTIVALSLTVRFFRLSSRPIAPLL